MEAAAKAVAASGRGDDPIDQASGVGKILGILRRLMQRQQRQRRPRDVSGRGAVLRRILRPDFCTFIPPARQVGSTLANRAGAIGVADPAVLEAAVVARRPAQRVADRPGFRHIAAGDQRNDGERVVVDERRRGDARRQAGFIHSGFVTADEDRVGPADQRGYCLVQPRAKAACRLRLSACSR